MKALLINRFNLQLLIISIVIGFVSCEKYMADGNYQISDGKMIDEIIEDNPDLSSFLKIIDISGLRGTVHAYGSYTMFVPTNAAVEKYLTEKGISSISNIPESDAAEIVKYHLIASAQNDSLMSTDFVDGRMKSPNFSNYYLTTKTLSDPALGVYVEINRQAKLINKDIRAVNGYVQIIDDVLYHPEKTVGEAVMDLPDNYSFWKTIFELSGIDLTDNSKDYTLFVQSNEAFAAAGINNMDDLMVELRAKNPDITDDQELINQYVGYHTTTGYNYVVDLMNKSSLVTQTATNEVIVLKRNVEQVLLNEFEIGGVLEVGVPINRLSDYSDLTCANGVIQDINGNIQIIKRSAYRVYWDLAEQPELMEMKNFRKTGAEVKFERTELAGIKYGRSSGSGTISYVCEGVPTQLGLVKQVLLYGDCLKFRFSSNTINWIEFQTPVLVTGTYKMYFVFRGLGASTSQDIRPIFKQDGKDDQILTVVTTTYNKQPASYGLTAYDNEFHQKAILDGYRTHLVNSSSYYDTANNCQALGVVQVESTGSHTLRLEALRSTQFETRWDMILFIPIDEDQIWPKQDLVGKLIYENTPVNEIYPYNSVAEPEDDEEE